MIDKLDGYIPSAIHDVINCKEDLQGKTPALSTHRKKSFEKLITFLVNELGEDYYKVQGPVLKLLQSLFIKILICCRQKNVSVIGDMMHATLLVKDEEYFRGVVKRIEEAFPSIHGKEF
eukprot:8892873-Ditylum_brightwellii.AAC.1